MTNLLFTGSTTDSGKSPRLRAFVSLAIIACLAISLPVNAQQAQAVSPFYAQPTISGPLTLADAVQTALKYNPMLQGAVSEVSAARAGADMAAAMTRPQVSASVFAGTSTMGDIISSPPNVMPSDLFTIPSTGTVSGQAALMFPLFTGGRLSSAVRGARALSTAASSDRATTERDVALETKTAYHAALLAQASVDVYSNLVKEEQERVRIAEAAFRDGKIAKYDLLRNQSGLAEAQQQLSNAERDAQIALVDLKTALGVDSGSNVTLSDQLTYAEVNGTSDSYLEAAVNNRPELAAARARIASAQANVQVARSAYQPQVYADIMEGVSAASDTTNTGFTAGIVVGLPILDGGVRSAAVQEAEAMLDVTKHDDQQALLGVQQDVNTVWAELQAAAVNVQLSETAVTQAEEDYRVIKLRYEAGKAINVEVLDALQSLVSAQNDRLMALYQHNIARDRLARAIGNL